MVEVAEEFVETMHCRQKLIFVTEMVLAELAGHVAVRLEQFGDSGVFRLKSDVGARHAYLGQPRADRVLACNEGRASCGAALLAVVVGKGHTFVGHTIDVGCAITHLPAIVVTDVPPANIVAPEDQRCSVFSVLPFQSPFDRVAV